MNQYLRLNFLTIIVIIIIISMFIVKFALVFYLLFLNFMVGMDWKVSIMVRMLVSMFIVKLATFFLVPYILFLMNFSVGMDWKMLRLDLIFSIYSCPLHLLLIIFSRLYFSFLKFLHQGFKEVIIRYEK